VNSQLVYQLRNADGTVVPDSYVIAVEASSSNEFHDLVYVIHNVVPFLPGDYNQDQTVDAPDYVLPRTSQNNDLSTCRSNYGNGITPLDGPTSAFDQYAAIQRWVSMHFGLVTYDSVAPQELGSATSDINAFNPTNFLHGMEDWFDEATKLGAQGARFVAHY